MSTDAGGTVLPGNVQAEREVGWLYTLSATVLLLAGPWLLMVAERGIQYGLALAGVLGGIAFASRARACFARASSAPSHFLQLLSDSLVVHDAGSERRLPWSAVQATLVDEDRLCVVLHLADGRQLPLEPRYGNLGLQALADLLAEKVKSACP